MAALSCFPVAIGATPIFPANPANQTYSSRRDVDPDEISAGQSHDDEGIEQVEAKGRGNE
jgi:hypothetical protein